MALKSNAQIDTLKTTPEIKSIPIKIDKKWYDNIGIRGYTQVR